MYVKIVKPFATNDENRIQGSMVGDVVQVSDEDAEKWIAAGLVEPVGVKPAAGGKAGSETADATGPSETAEGKGKKRGK